MPEDWRLKGKQNQESEKDLQQLEKKQISLGRKLLRFSPEIRVRWTPWGTDWRFSNCMASVTQNALYDLEGRDRRVAPSGCYTLAGVSFSKPLVIWKHDVPRVGEVKKYYQYDFVAMQDFVGRLVVTPLAAAAAALEFGDQYVAGTALLSAGELRDAIALVSPSKDKLKAAFEAAYVEGSGLSPVHVPDISSTEGCVPVSQWQGAKRSHEENEEENKMKQQKMSPPSYEMGDGGDFACITKVDHQNGDFVSHAGPTTSQRDQHRNWQDDFKMETTLYTSGLKMKFIPKIGGKTSPVGRLPGHVSVVVEVDGVNGQLASVIVSLEDVQSSWKAWIPLETKALQLQQQDEKDLILTCEVRV